MSHSPHVADNRPRLAEILERLYWSFVSSGDKSKRFEWGQLLLWFTKLAEGPSQLMQYDLVEFARRKAYNDALVGVASSPPPPFMVRGEYGRGSPYPDDLPCDLLHVEARLAELDADGTTDNLWRELCRRSPEAASAFQVAEKNGGPYSGPRKLDSRLSYCRQSREGESNGT